MSLHGIIIVRLLICIIIYNPLTRLCLFIFVHGTWGERKGLGFCWLNSQVSVYLWILGRKAMTNRLRQNCVCAQSCPTLGDPMDCSPPGSTVHGVSQARILEWVAYPFSRRSFQPGNQTRVSCTACRFFTN